MHAWYFVLINFNLKPQFCTSFSLLLILLDLGYDEAPPAAPVIVDGIRPGHSDYPNTDHQTPSHFPPRHHHLPVTTYWIGHQTTSILSVVLNPLFTLTEFTVPEFLKNPIG